MDKILLHPKTASAVNSYLSSPTQVLALIGGSGSGKRFLAHRLVSTMLGKTDLSNESRMIIIEPLPDKKEIAIEAIRDLIKRLRVKQPGSSRIVYIDSAERLSAEAQNALLKTLEQPNPDTYFILGVSDSSRLLPTVFSRTQKLVIYPVLLSDSLEFFKGQFSVKDIQTAWLLSDGRAGQLNSLLNDEQQPLKMAINTAKKFLANNRYERLAQIDTFSKNKDELNNLLIGLARILKSLHYTNIRSGKNKTAAKLLNARKATQQSQKTIEANASPKAVLLKLILNLEV